ncbi:MAG: penicillin-binding protein 2 [Thermodesulfobacteriota bacterium]|nr:penicillin-binding protein 2 [Thermodesulfobacteriota bacterium]
MSKYLKTADSNWYKQRIIGTMVCVLAAFSILLVRLFFLQVIKGEEFERLSENNSIRLQNIDPSRGMIFDRGGKLLVDNRPSFDVSIILKDARPVNETIKKLSKYIKFPADELKSTIASKKNISLYKPILLKQDIGRDTMAGVEVHKYELPGIVVNANPRRHYINRQSAAHLIGYLGEISPAELSSGKFPGCRQGDLIGKYGVEKAHQSLLKGKRGGRQVEVNAVGQVIKVLKTVDSQPGHNYYLTIDHVVQEKTEALLEGVIGAAVAMEPATGQILALVSNPSFDQNSFVCGMSQDQWDSLTSDPLKPLTNRVVQGEYAPASTYKIVTAIAGLEEGVIDENTTFKCPGYYHFQNREYRCWKKTGHGTMSIVKALAESCDVFFYNVGQRVGVDRLAWYAIECGLGTKTGINLDHEMKGLIPTAAWKKRRFGIEWQEGETLSIAIGQGFNLVTPLQMVTLISAVANGGYRYRPEILKHIETADGKIVRESKPKRLGRLPASSKTLELVKQGLWEVVNYEKGTARGARVYGIDVSGKTGTAQVISRKEDEDEAEEELPDHLRPHAWFVAYAPSENPKIAVAVVVEHGEHGSGSAAPVAREMIKTYLRGEKHKKQLVAQN